MKPKVAAFLTLLGLAIAMFACSTHDSLAPLKYPAYSHVSGPSAGSYAPEVIPVYVDKDFRDDQREDIHAAFDEWNYAFNGFRTYLVVSDNFTMEDEETIARIVRTRQGVIVLSIPDMFLDLSVPRGVLAWVDDLYDPIIHIASGRMGTRDLKKITMHELGHVLGLEHTEAAHTLMSQYYQDQINCIDRYTLQTLAGTDLARALHWDWRRMNSCDVG